MKKSELRTTIEQQLEKYRTFGSVESEDFTPVGFFDSYSDFQNFLEELVDLCWKEVKPYQMTKPFIFHKPIKDSLGNIVKGAHTKGMRCLICDKKNSIKWPKE